MASAREVRVFLREIPPMHPCSARTRSNTRHDAHLRTSLKIKGSLIRIRCSRYVDTTRCGLLDRGRLQIDLAYDPRSPFAGLMCGKNVPLNQPQHRHLAHPPLSCCLVACELRSE